MQCRSLIAARAALGLTLAFAAAPNGLPAASQTPPRKSPRGPLRVHPENPRYFTDGSGRAVYLTGSHTWMNLQDASLDGRSLPFDYPAFLDFLARNHHNFFRLWTWESPQWVLPNSRVVRVSPLAFARTGPGQAIDGQPKFDLTKFEPAYFTRLRQRVQAAQARDIYVGVMLFQGFSVARKTKRRRQSPWAAHPLNPANNVNGVDGDRNGDGEGYETHTLADPRIMRLQEAYVRQVVDTVNDLDNVLYEISNESQGASTAWQYHWIRFIHRYEKTLPRQHPVWMSFQWDGRVGRGTDANLFRSPAEAVSPRGQDTGRGSGKCTYAEDPPVADGAKVILADTDHLWGIGGTADWVWKCFTRGLNPIFMDPYRHSPHHPAPDLDPRWNPVRRALGYTRRWAERIDLARLTPTDDPALCSTRYCLQQPGGAYLIYQPHAASLAMRLPPGRYAGEWFDPVKGKTIRRVTVTARGGQHRFTAPWAGPAVLYLSLPTEQQNHVPHE